jgi:CheY-like chemotaxis protein
MNKKKILLIDDEVSNTRPMKVNLERTGCYTVQTENNALHSLETARRFKPDLIFLDVMMPDMDGGQVAAQMEIDPALKNVPIVFLTAIVTKKETGEQGVVKSGHKFIAKPLNLEGLVACIEKNTANLSTTR